MRIPARLIAFGLLLISSTLFAQDLPVEPSSEPAKVRALVFGMTPVVGVEHTKTRFRALKEHMAQQLGRPVELLVTESYGDLVNKVEAGQVDLAKFSPLAYVRARRRIPDLALIATQVAKGSVDYSSYLVALQDNPHAAFAKLKGARICFADPASTSGFLFPAHHLEQAGLSLERDFSKITFGGNHRTCLEGLFDGRWDVAATWAGAIGDARNAGRDVGELLIVAKAGRIPFDAWCLRPGLEPALGDQVTRILLSTSTLTRAGRRVLAPTLGINGWVPVQDEVYDGIRQIDAAHQKPTTPHSAP